MTTTATTADWLVGQWVSTNVCGARSGVVIEVSDEAPATMKRHGAPGSLDGRVWVDVVFEDGVILHNLDARWLRRDKFLPLATSEEIAGLLANAEQQKAREQAEKQATERRRARERQHHAADNRHLVKVTDRPDWSAGRLVAENVRRELRLAFPGVRFSVRCDCNYVNVSWTGGPAVGEVEQITSRYYVPGYNGTEPAIERRADATFGAVFGMASRITLHRE